MSDPRRALVRRVAGSAAFQKTWRLRELFLFLCERALTDPASPPREAEIGAAVFGRGEEFDPGVDPLVRVQASQLRKRLHLYFTTEGAAEPLVIEIPKGAYTAVFRERVGETLEEPEPEEPARPPRSPLVVPLAAAAVVLTLMCAFLWMQNRSLRRHAPGGAESVRPTVERLWRQVFAREGVTPVVLADGNLAVFLDTARRTMSATEYGREQLRTRSGAPSEPPEVEFARQLAVRRFTTIADADLAHEMGALGATLGASTELFFARDATPDQFKAHHIVVSGPLRANPWVELFETRLTFQSRYDPAAGVTFFANTAPQSGEPAELRAEADKIGYCRVAFVPNLDATGRALLITGTDAAANAAGVELVTDETALRALADRLGVSGTDAEFPSFEALLRVDLQLGAPTGFEVVAHRVRRE